MDERYESFIRVFNFPENFPLTGCTHRKESEPGHLHFAVCPDQVHHLKDRELQFLCDVQHSHSRIVFFAYPSPQRVLVGLVEGDGFLDRGRDAPVVCPAGRASLGAVGGGRSPDMMAFLAFELGVFDVPSVRSAFRALLGGSTPILPGMSAFGATEAVASFGKFIVPRIGRVDPERPCAIWAYADIVLVHRDLGEFFRSHGLIRFCRDVAGHVHPRDVLLIGHRGD